MLEDPTFFLQVLPGRYQSGARSATPCLPPGCPQGGSEATSMPPSGSAHHSWHDLLTKLCSLHVGTARGCPRDAQIPPHSCLG